MFVKFYRKLNFQIPHVDEDDDDNE